MDYLFKYWRRVDNLHRQTLTAHISAYPSFLLEFFLAIMVSIVYLYLCYELTKIYKQTVRIRPHTIHYRRPTPNLKGNFSRDSIRTSITRIQEFCEYDVVENNMTLNRKRRASKGKMEWLLKHQTPGDFFRPFQEKRISKQESLAALTPAQFVKLDKRRQMRERKMNGCMHSLTKLFDSIVSGNIPTSVIKEQLDKAKEDVACSRASDQVMKYLDTESVTESLINILNDIVEDATLENPLPVKGDVASLICDIGNLKTNSSIIFDTTCELVPSCSSFSTVTKSDVSDQ